jgi:acyl-CoA reductase-like NAD-dependent aldehyde dehydrogenase
MLKSTDLKKIGTIVKNTTEAFEKGVTISYESRIKNLTTLQKFLKENEKNFSEALFKDLHMNDLACNVEIHEPCNTAEEAMENLSTWMKPSHPSIPLLQKPGSATIEKEPFGVVLIIAPWNYPVGLLMKPMIGAIAAGNAVIIKPSEVTENVSNVFAEKFKTFFPGDEISVVTGGVAETSELLKHKFDYIFYTGSPEVGKIIMRAASEHLTPVTLELGGKCPVYVDSEVDMEVAVSRISFGKWFNAGQTCVAPDYILCDQSKKEEFMKKMASKITQFFGENPQQSDDFGRIVSEKHVKRLEGLIQNEKIYHGGKVIDLKDRYFEPTILDNPDVNSKVMKDEV